MQLFGFMFCGGKSVNHQEKKNRKNHYNIQMSTLKFQTNTFNADYAWRDKNEDKRKETRSGARWKFKLCYVYMERNKMSEEKHATFLSWNRKKSNIVVAFNSYRTSKFIKIYKKTVCSRTKGTEKKKLCFLTIVYFLFVVFLSFLQDLCVV